MTEEIQAIRDDIAFLRALAEEGRQAPLLGGSMLVSAGAIYGTMSLVQWAIIVGVLRLPGAGLLILWLAAVAGHMASIVVLRRGIGAKPGARSAGNRAMRNAWAGVGWSIFAIFTALGLASWKTGDLNLIAFSPSIVLALYGGAWSIAAALSGQVWLRGVAIASFGAAILMAAILDTPWIWLAYAAALYLLAMAPGLVLMRQEPSDVV